MNARIVSAVAALAVLAGCATLPTPPDPALASTDPLISAAALLVAADAARTDEARAPMIARLDALGVSVLAATGPTTSDDPLTEWRRRYTPAAGEVYRGRTLGPAYRRAQLAAGERLVIEQIFTAGERAEMAAQTSGGQPVALAVANNKAEKVCEAQLTPHARCRWMPIYTERFQITLTNRGTTPASVYLVFD